MPVVSLIDRYGDETPLPDIANAPLADCPLDGRYGGCFAFFVTLNEAD